MLKEEIFSKQLTIMVMESRSIFSFFLRLRLQIDSHRLDYNEFKRLVEKRVVGCFRHWAKGTNTITIADAQEALKDLKLKIDPKAFVATLDR